MGLRPRDVGHESILSRHAVQMVCKTGLVERVAQRALQLYGFGGEGAGRLESAGAFLAQGVAAGG